MLGHNADVAGRADDHLAWWLNDADYDAYSTAYPVVDELRNLLGMPLLICCVLISRLKADAASLLLAAADSKRDALQAAYFSLDSLRRLFVTALLICRSISAG